MHSSPSSRSASPEASLPNAQIFIKPISGDTFPLTVSLDLPISTLTHLLSARTSLPASTLRLVHAGTHLREPHTLADYHITRSSTLHLTAPLRGGMPPKKIRCTYKDCKEGAQRIIGDCGFCNGHYCGRHRLLEDHKCDGLEDCKKESHERNAVQLNKERTQVIRGI